jgi:hypothetical protein
MPPALVLGGRVGVRSGPRRRTETDRVAEASALAPAHSVRRRPSAELDAPVGSAPWKGAVRKRPPEEVRPAAAGSLQTEMDLPWNGGHSIRAVRRRPPEESRVAELDAPVGSAPWKGAPNHAVRKRPPEEVRPAVVGSWQAEPAAIRKRPPAEDLPAERARQADRPTAAAGQGGKRSSSQPGAAPRASWGAPPEPQPVARADPRWGHGVVALEEAARYAPFPDRSGAPGGVVERAHAAVGGVIGHAAAEPGRRRLVGRGVVRTLGAHERNALYSSARAESLATKVSDGHVLLWSAGSDPERGAIQVPDAAERRKQFVSMLTRVGGKRGEGLDAVGRAIELLSAHAIRSGDPDPLCLPASGTLVNHLLHTEQARLDGAGARLRTAFRWMREHLRWPIDVDIGVTDAAALGAAPAQMPLQAAKQKAGTLPLGYKCQLEHEARAQTPSCLRHMARSLLLAGIDVSIRVEDSEAASMRVDGVEPDDVVVVYAPITKDGSPILLYAPARGFLGPYDWLQQHRADIDAAGGRMFPAWVRPYGSKGLVAAATEWQATGAATKEDIRSLQIEISARSPLRMPAEAWGKRGPGALNLTGHSQHGTLTDWGKGVGALPPALPYAAAIAAAVPPAVREIPPRGFLKDECRAFGHWLRDKDAVSTASAPHRGGAEHTVMEQRYTEGEEREGERTEQLRLRSRMADYGAAAIAGWESHWGSHWWNLPCDRTSCWILWDLPEKVPPRPTPPPLPPPRPVFFGPEKFRIPKKRPKG